MGEAKNNLIIRTEFKLRSPSQRRVELLTCGCRFYVGFIIGNNLQLLPALKRRTEKCFHRADSRYSWCDVKILAYDAEMPIAIKDDDFR